MRSDQLGAAAAPTGFFSTMASPGEGTAEGLERSAPDNPFCTAAYLQTMRLLGHETWVIGIRHEGTVVAASLALLKSGRLARTLEIPSLSTTDGDARFWDGLHDFCVSHNVTDLDVNTFHSRPLAIPSLPGEFERRKREEHILHLRENFAQAFSSDHKRNLKKARSEGMSLRSTREPSAVDTHVRLMEASTTRRLERGENISLHLDTTEYRSYLETGAGELYQAVHKDKVVSSALVLKSKGGAYYHTSGTTPEGMRMGASRFLISSIAEELKGAGITIFNLGGAEEGSSLAKFKEGFGAEAVALTAVRCYIGPVWKRKLRSAAALARGDRQRFLRAIRGEIDRYVLYSADPSQIHPAAPAADVEFRALSEVEMHAIEDAEFRQRQLNRLDILGASSAYAVFANKKIGHISWLVPADAVNREPSKLLHLEDFEAEITGCETLPEFRGRGLYPFAIRQICAIASERGIRRIYMKTRADNTASRAGIGKAGLRRTATLLHIAPPALPSKRWLLRLP